MYRIAFSSETLISYYRFSYYRGRGCVGTLEHWHIGTLERWNVRVFEGWNVGKSERWNMAAGAESLRDP